MRALRPRLEWECDLKESVVLISKNFAVSVYESNGTFSLLCVFYTLNIICFDFPLF